MGSFFVFSLHTAQVRSPGRAVDRSRFTIKRGVRKNIPFDMDGFSAMQRPCEKRQPSSMVSTARFICALMTASSSDGLHSYSFRPR